MNRREFLKALGVGAAAVAFVPHSPVAFPVSETVLNVGDMFTISGQYSVNPQTGKSTGYLQHFVITQVSTSDVEIVPPVNGSKRISRHRVEPLLYTAP